MNEMWTKKEVATLTAMVNKHGANWDAMRDEMEKMGFIRTSSALRRKWAKLVLSGEAAHGWNVQMRRKWDTASDAVLLTCASRDMLEHPFSETDDAARRIDAMIDGLKARNLPHRTPFAIRSRLGILKARMRLSASAAPTPSPQQLDLGAPPQAHNYVDASPRALVLVVSALRSARLARVAHAMRCATRSREYARTEAAA